MRTIFHNKTLLFYLISFIIQFCCIVNGRRGPHHPHSEVDKTRKKLDSHIAREDEHIQEDLQYLDVESKNVEEMTNEEKNFYYFKIHDSDNNDLLDGLELYHAATHHTNHLHNTDPSHNDINAAEEKLNEFKHIIEVIDNFIETADLNIDGYLDYPEYIKAVVDSETISQIKEETFLNDTDEQSSSSQPSTSHHIEHIDNNLKN